MKILVRFFCLSLAVNFSFTLSDIRPNLEHFNSQNLTITNPHIIAVMVEFDKEIINNPLTSGDGTFLDSIDIDMVWDGSGRDRCDGFIVDPPPHNSSYFKDQIIAVSNYYNYITDKGRNIITT